MGRFVLHVDLDQFIAAVEVLRRPDLRDVPVVVGGDGDPTKRGVVSTASYEARRFGIRSGMPLRTAARRCPEAVFLPVDAEAYHEASGKVMRTLRTFPAVVEVAGWDEAYLDVEAEDPEALAAEIQRAVLGATGLSCSVGIGDNKLRAKIASDMRKPGGVFRLTRSNWRTVMEGRPTEALWGIGRKTAGRLAEAGLHTVGDLARADVEALAAAFGPSTGPWLRSLAEGESTWKVSSDPHVAKGRGKERTYQRDIGDREEIVRGDRQALARARGRDRRRRTTRRSRRREGAIRAVLHAHPRRLARSSDGGPAGDRTGSDVGARPVRSGPARSTPRGPRRVRVPAE